jgi:hypothetical protein
VGRVDDLARIGGEPEERGPIRDAGRRHAPLQVVGPPLLAERRRARDHQLDVTRARDLSNRLDQDLVPLPAVEPPDEGDADRRGGRRRANGPIGDPVGDDDDAAAAAGRRREPVTHGV